MAEACACCDFEDPVDGLGAYRQNSGGEVLLCVLCASTFAGIAHEYPSGYTDRPTLKTMCWIGNQLRKDLRDLPPARPIP